MITRGACKPGGHGAVEQCVMGRDGPRGGLCHAMRVYADPLRIPRSARSAALLMRLQLSDFIKQIQRQRHAG